MLILGPPPSPASRLMAESPLSFDGNTTAALTNWLIPTDAWKGLTEESIEQLLHAMVNDGNVGWLVLVWNGYRV